MATVGSQALRIVRHNRPHLIQFFPVRVRRFANRFGDSSWAKSNLHMGIGELGFVAGVTHWRGEGVGWNSLG
jgi:hypothetical protein